MYSILKIALLIISIVYDSNSNGSSISDEYGEGIKIVPKCCPGMSYVYCDIDLNCSCEKDDLAMDIADFSKVPVYNENLEFTGYNLTDIFKIVSGSLQKVFLIGESEQPFLLENGKLHLKISYPNTPEKVHVMDKENYCVDYMKTNESNHPEITFSVTVTVPDRSFKIKLNTAGYITSSIFLALVLMVYTMFAPLRNLVGKIIMCLTASLLGCYLAIAVLTLKIWEQGSVTVEFCFGINFCIYLFLLASFFWMNVLSFDIWKRFRRKTHQRSNRDGRGLFEHKFLMYSIYAWGTPSVMGIIMILIEIDIIDVTSMPRFIKPNFIVNGCFFGETELELYLYTPMLILILCNWTFYFMTAYAIWRVKREVRTLGVTSTPNNIKERLKICLRLSLVMGITWVLEVVSAKTPDLPIWYITDLYNILNGVGIFVITVCNKKVYKLIVQRFGSRSPFRTPISSSQTPDSTLSDESTNESQQQRKSMDREPSFIRAKSGKVPTYLDYRTIK